MACGLPVIVTGRGPALDFCTEETAYFVPAEEARIPAEDWPPELPTVRPATWFEPDTNALRGLMRHVFENRDEAKRKGDLAARARPGAIHLGSYGRADGAPAEAMARRLTTGQPDIVWRAPLFDVTGYANDAREFVLGLAEAGARVRAVPIPMAATCLSPRRTRWSAASSS